MSNWKETHVEGNLFSSKTGARGVSFIEIRHSAKR